MQYGVWAWLFLRFPAAGEAEKKLSRTISRDLLFFLCLAQIVFTIILFSQ